MDNEINNLISYKPKVVDKNIGYSLDDALREFDEIKKIALNCFDKNGNPNISAALRAIENKAKVAGLYKVENKQFINAIQMKEIVIDGEQLKLNIGEEFFE
ncbi:MAG: hypothetical protein IKU37_02410 [Candidatus Gastranaerophilales bacterium]|nr:hypothetical protein [Candidatus Gastranaerophilales bacterium]